MGVDSFIFDEVSKDCLYFDRKWNFFDYGSHDAKLQEVLDKMDATWSKGKRATAEDVVYVCEANIRCDNRPGWNATILKFVLARSNGSFFSASDHDYDYCHDIIDKDGYRIIGYDKDGNEVEGLL